MRNTGVPARKANNTWLAGKVKCGRCGAALIANANPRGYRYFRCRRRSNSKFSCEGCGTLRVEEFEALIYGEMVKKLADFQTLTANNTSKANPKLTMLNVELAQVDAEIAKLIDSLTGANATLISYANSKVEELDARKQSLTKAIADMKAASLSPEHLSSISNYLENWNDVSFEDRRLVADGLIAQIRATDASFQVEWKI